MAVFKNLMTVFKNLFKKKPKSCRDCFWYSCSQVGYVVNSDKSIREIGENVEYCNRNGSFKLKDTEACALFEDF